MGNCLIKLKGGECFDLQSEKPVMTLSPYCKLVLKIGVSGENGVDGAYNSPGLTAIVDGTTFVIPAGKTLHSIAVVPQAGDRVLTVGYSAGTGELIDSEDIPSNDGVSFAINRYYNAGQTLHFSGFTGQVRIYLL